MPPIPHTQKKKKVQLPPKPLSTDDVTDDMGRTLTTLLRSQKRTDLGQTTSITVARQHASQNESSQKQRALIFRDVFPGRKYNLTLSDTTWIVGSATITIGYTVGDTFTPIAVDPPEDNTYVIEIPAVQAVDTLEARLTGAPDKVRGYLEDATTSNSILDKIKEIVELITGTDGINSKISALQSSVSTINDSISGINDSISSIDDTLSDHESRISDLENQPQST